MVPWAVDDGMQPSVGQLRSTALRAADPFRLLRSAVLCCEAAAKMTK